MHTAFLLNLDKCPEHKGVYISRYVHISRYLLFFVLLHGKTHVNTNNFNIGHKDLYIYIYIYI